MKEVKHFLGAAAGVTASGFARAQPALKAARLEACRLCPQYEAGPGRCRACGCRMDLKAGFASVECPERRWPEPTGVRGAGD